MSERKKLEHYHSSFFVPFQKGNPISHRKNIYIKEHITEFYTQESKKKYIIKNNEINRWILKKQKQKSRKKRIVGLKAKIENQAQPATTVV